MHPIVHVIARRVRLGRVTRWVLACVLAAIVVIPTLLAFNWPFTETKIVRDLEHFSSSEVKIQRVRQTYFPHPGYVAEGLKFLRRSNGHAVEMSSVKRLACMGSWMSLVAFQHRVWNLNINGLHVSIPAPVPPAIPFYPSMKTRTTITTLTADGTVLDIAPRRPGGRALRFTFHKLVLNEVKKEKSIRLETVVHVPLPPGDLTVRGRFGPLEKGHIADTPVSGSYGLERGDLAHMKTIGGTLSSDGSFQGTLSQCQVGGKVRIDNFQVQKVQHPVDLYAKFHTVVNGLKGDVAIHSAQVRFLKTELHAVGRVQTLGHENGKTESINITASKAQIEDLLTLFTRSNPPALRGPISLKADIVLPPGPQDFLRKLRLNGEFNIPQAEFLHPNTQKSVNKLSKRARGKKAKDNGNAGEPIPSSFDADVTVQNGTATLSNANFSTRGATVSGHGTYNLLTQRINLRGKLAMEASLSKAAGGLKSVFLIPLDPFFKKGNAGAVLPIHVSGTYSNPSFHVSLTGRK